MQRGIAHAHSGAFFSSYSKVANMSNARREESMQKITEITKLIITKTKVQGVCIILKNLGFMKD